MIAFVRTRMLPVIAGLLGIALVATGWRTLDASAAAGDLQAATIHPAFPLLDASGTPVIDSGNALSLRETCGGCHDTEFIAQHNMHAIAGLDTFGPPGSASAGRAWETSDGLFGRWDPLVYRLLTPIAESPLDLGTPEWVQVLGARHVGGGPAEIARDGTPLPELEPEAGNPETSVLDPATGAVRAWDWDASGTAEVNCLLCHMPEPNNVKRLDSLAAGDFGWAATATLVGTGLVEPAPAGYRWNADRFDANGVPEAEALTVQDPTNDNCGLCHGLVHDDLAEPVVGGNCDSSTRRTALTGQIVAGSRISDSGLNLAGKSELSRSWDAHAERRLECTDCHYSQNNPVYSQEDPESRPEHLAFDPRRLELGEYLARPSHELASSTSEGSEGTMRGCDSCHDADIAHDWLPSKDRHFAELACETCHIPRLYSNALQEVDWTVVTSEGRPRTECRGLDLTVSEEPLVTGYEPVWLPNQEGGGDSRLTPYNLVTTWYWVAGDPPRPVRLIDLQAAWFEGDGYDPDLLAALDDDGDGTLSSPELVLDSLAKVDLIAARLAALGLDEPRIEGEVQPYPIHHGIAGGEWAIRDCQTCHTDESRVAAGLTLGERWPSGGAPTFVRMAAAPLGATSLDADGAWVYRPDPAGYVLGHNRVQAVDWAGAILFLGVIGAISVHATLRFVAARRSPTALPETRLVPMYGRYERLWHWLQTFTIAGLLFTGLVIHRPDAFSFLDFRAVIVVHNVLSAILVINAALALFYHLASGEIRQYIPRPVGFFDQAILQARYYLVGIFRGDPHPFEKVPERKLNPLQQITYVGLLNILLPLMVFTGILMWAVGRWPEVAGAVGGLGLLGPIHSAVAWLLAVFMVGHVYLTTTGPTPSASLQGMIFGLEPAEKHLAPGMEGEA